MTDGFQSKLILLRGYEENAVGIDELGLPTIEMPELFMSQKLVPQSGISHPVPAWLAFGSPEAKSLATGDSPRISHRRGSSASASSQRRETSRPPANRRRESVPPPSDADSNSTSPHSDGPPGLAKPTLTSDTPAVYKVPSLRATTYSSAVASIILDPASSDSDSIASVEDTANYMRSPSVPLTARHLTPNIVSLSIFNPASSRNDSPPLSFQPLSKRKFTHCLALSVRLSSFMLV